MKQMFAALVASALLAAPAFAKTPAHAHVMKAAKAHHAHSMHKTSGKGPMLKMHKKHAMKMKKHSMMKGK